MRTTGGFSTNEIPIEVRNTARHLWESIKPLVQVKPDDEPKVLAMIAGLLIMYIIHGEMAEYVRQSPVYQRLVGEMKKRFQEIEDQAESSGAEPSSPE